MSIIFALMMISFTVFITVGGSAIIQDKKAALNRTFFLLNLSFAAYAFATGFTLVAADEASLGVWTNINSLGIFSFAAFTLHFSLIYTQKSLLLKKWWVYAVIYFPFVFFIAMQLTTGFYAADYIQTRFGWNVAVNHKSVLFWLFNAYYIAFCGTGVVLFLVKWKNAKSLREKKQAQTISLASAVTLLLSGVVYTISVFYPTVPNIAPLTTILWALGIMYGIVRYKLLVITPELAAEQILRTISESVLIVSETGNITSANSETVRILGYPSEELIGKPLGLMFSGDDKFRQENIRKLFKQCPIQNMETHLVSKDGKNIPVIFSATECRDEGGELLGYVTATRDITSIKEAEERLNYLAHHDSLTSLPNRLLFVDRFNQEAAKARRNKTYIAVMLLDLDHFKEVNDVYGHNIGDLLLVEVSNRLQSAIRQSDSIARLGGDEFVMLLSDLKSENDYTVIADRIVESIAETYIIEGNQINVTISVGVSIYPINGISLDSLLRDSDIAMYSVKTGGRNSHRLFTTIMSSAVGEIPNLEDELRSALENDQLMLYYQPMVDLYSEKIIGAEALIRWDHPEYGIISPAEFIPQAEKNGLIVPIGDWVLRTACVQAKKWHELGFGPVYVSVNLSAFQFKEKNLAESILDILAESKLPPEYLLLEITENNIVRDKENVTEVLKKLHDHNVMVVISGFGTGYSSLIYLKEFPIYAIKIDRFFIRNIVSDPGCAAIVKAIISLAHDLNVKVIAEGIETAEQSRYLRSLEWKPENPVKCDGAQGFLFGRPVPGASINEMFEKQADKAGAND